MAKRKIPQTINRAALTKPPLALSEIAGTGKVGTPPAGQPVKFWLLPDGSIFCFATGLHIALKTKGNHANH